LLEIEPLTGRMHQIRVQAAQRGWPIWGDIRYGARTEFGPPPALERDRGIALHARRLTFLHPIRFEPITVVADTDLFEVASAASGGSAESVKSSSLPRRANAGPSD
jgi:23S rRNA-/tRNA-specific pseudouridylate synthase